MEGDRPKAVPFFIGMTKLIEKLKTLVENEAEALGTFVVGHSSGEKGLYRFYVDSAEPLSLYTLSELTKQVSVKIDEGEFGDEAFTFEISSPGADKPLNDIRQFHKHIGRTFDLELDNDTNFTGKLTKIEQPELTFDIEYTEKINGKKTVIKDQRVVQFEHIKTATIKISFK